MVMGKECTPWLVWIPAPGFEFWDCFVPGSQVPIRSSRRRFMLGLWVPIVIGALDMKCLL